MKGIVVKGYGLFYTVKYNNQRINCTLRGILRKKLDSKRFSNPIAVGDFVTISTNDDGTGTIDDIDERRNIFSRKEKGRTRKEDIIACNLDRIIVIQSFKQPKLNLRFVDRLIIRGQKENIPVILCVNKTDLAAAGDIDYVKNYYRGAGIDILFVCAIEGKGVSELKNIISGKTSLLAGYSGAGKTSLLNAIYPHLDLRVSEVSESTGKGRHTTTNVSMVTADNNTNIIDTPGLREFGLMDIEPHTLETFFPEFSGYRNNCVFSPCTHDHEPKCEIKKQVDAGHIFKDRYISYLYMLNSLKEYYNRMY
ncbi:MAG TPA: ribosome small subunit-dependent GTPase A [Spirochaetota bacterium]|nr:ribosome small subunit-dependent GTPase A [Spirochaetota bacterium]HPJ38182.1 ribosome small subunit-dependent GTPase A [Spirochaetota bacterium]HPQ51656.1 ribosome small subunit-dependent GTPase A [Spirochaetota bacterium]